MLPNLGFFFHFSASLNEVCIKVNITVQKSFLIHFINMQLNFPVLSLFNCVAPQKAGFMACRMQVQLFSLFLETEHFLKRSYLRTSLLQATLLLHSVYTDKTKEKWIIFHTLDKIADFH